MQNDLTKINERIDRVKNEIKALKQQQDDALHQAIFFVRSDREHQQDDARREKIKKLVTELERLVQELANLQKSRASF